MTTTQTIIRDFAYQPSDPRYDGIYPALNEAAKTNKEKPPVPSNLLSEDYDEDDVDDTDVHYPDWKWSWNYNNVKKQKKIGIYCYPSLLLLIQTLVPPLLDINHFKLTLLAFLNATLQDKLPNLDLEVSYGKTIFPFVKGTEYEMSLESPDELFVISTKAGKPLAPKEKSKERWSSIDEIGEPETMSKKDVSIILEPPVDNFVHEVDQFLGYNKNYGDGWLTALKLKILGNWESKKIRVQLVDLGLVPGNYCQIGL